MRMSSPGVLMSPDPSSWPVALLSFALESERRAMALHRYFAAHVLMSLPDDSEWSIPYSDVLEWAQETEALLGAVWVNGAGAYLDELHT